MAPGWEPIGQLVLKAGLAIPAVAAAVFLGWWLNDRSKRLERVRDARADLCGTTYTASNCMRYVDVAEVGNDQVTKDHVNDMWLNMMAAKNAATAPAMKLTLLSPKDEAKVEPVASALAAMPTTTSFKRTSHQLTLIAGELRHVRDQWLKRKPRGDPQPKSSFREKIEQAGAADPPDDWKPF
jgi:hypothetical protein